MAMYVRTQQNNRQLQYILLFGYESSNWHVSGLLQGGLTSLFPPVKNNLPVGPKGQKPFLALFLKTNSHFL
jgi:hypothetical protein